MLLSIISAILGILAFPLVKIYPLGFIFLVPLFIVFSKETSLPKLLWKTLIFRIILITNVAFFVFEPFIFLLSSLIFLGLPLSIFLIKKLTNFLIDKYFSRFSDYRQLIINCSLFSLLPFIWTFWELAEAKYTLLPMYGFTVGNIFGSSPFLGLATFGGLTGLTVFAATVNCLIAFSIINFKKNNFRKSAILFLSVIFLISAGFLISRSELKKNSFAYQNLDTKLKVALVSNKENFNQGFEFFQHNILSPEEKTLAKTLIENKLKPIESELSGQKLDLIVFPEDMIHLDSYEDRDPEAKNKFGIENAGVLIGAYRQLAQGLNANLAATFSTVQNNKKYESTLLFNRQGKLVDIYNKVDMTIISEYWPFGSWHPFYYDIMKKIFPDKYGLGGAIFNKEAVTEPGQEKTLTTENITFGSVICGEIQHPEQIKILKKMGAEFISHATAEDWLVLGVKNLQELTNNLTKIESVWQQMPILITGRQEIDGLVMPDGKIDSMDFIDLNKDFGIFTGEIRIK